MGGCGENWLYRGYRRRRGVCVPARQLRKSETMNIHLKFLHVRFSGLAIKVCQFYRSGLSNEGSAEILQRSRGNTHLYGKERSNDLVCRHTSLPNTVSRPWLWNGREITPGVIDTKGSYCVQNQQLLADELYLGLRRPRVRGKIYDDFVDNFVQAARKLYPRAYIHLWVSLLSSQDWRHHCIVFSLFSRTLFWPTLKWRFRPW